MVYNKYIENEDSMLDAKLQLKPQQTLAIIDSPRKLEITAPRADIKTADALMVFIPHKAALQKYVHLLQQYTNQNKLTWIAYPKGGQLATDIHRDSIREFAKNNNLDPVRQIAIDGTWSALRFKSLT